MTTPDELQRAVERLKNAARNNDGTLIDKDYGEVFVCVSDLHLANEILSERAELLATVERMRGALDGINELTRDRLALIPPDLVHGGVLGELLLEILTRASHKDKP